MDTLFDSLPDIPEDIPERADLRVERALRSHGFAAIAGVDEVGRGCLAGPVVAAAVILREDADLNGLTDSKQLDAAARERLAPIIREAAVAYGVGSCSPSEIDRWNILHASLEAMRRAIDAMTSRPDVVLVDGNRPISRLDVPQRTLVKGDARSLTVAAASVLAKTTRDALMIELAARYPGYGWDSNLGYPTADHFEGLRQLGPSPEHRRSFRLRGQSGGQSDLFAT